MPSFPYSTMLEQKGTVSVMVTFGFGATVLRSL
jgi:hypothetical protein